mmetsp:Transcript_68669/g.182944  ORF Transcript_68669/g.182944 Transcript_68669/m.182944 type:complete len:493 (-) Transcript_68669:69-1547(-)
MPARLDAESFGSNGSVNGRTEAEVKAKLNKMRTRKMLKNHRTLQLDADDGHEAFQNWLLTIAVGTAGKPKLLRYNLQNLVRAGGLWTTPLTGSFVKVGPVLPTTLAVCLIQAVIPAILVVVLTEDVEKTRLGAGDLDELATYMNRFCPFFLGLYVSLTLSRWWALRVQSLGAMLDASCNIYWITASFLSGSQYHHTRVHVKSLLQAAVTMVTRMARGIDDTMDLVEDGLLQDWEGDVLADVELQERPLVIWTLVLRECTASMSAVGVAPPNQNMLILECLRARDAVQNIHTYLDSQLPFTYVHLIVTLVSVNNVLIVLKCGFTFGVAYLDGQSIKMLCQVIYLVVVPALYEALLCISYVLEDPFGEDMLDFPIAAYADAAKKFMKYAQAVLENYVGDQVEVEAAMSSRASEVSGHSLAHTERHKGDLPTVLAGVSALSAAMSAQQKAQAQSIRMMDSLKVALGELKPGSPDAIPFPTVASLGLPDRGTERWE